MCQHYNSFIHFVSKTLEGLQGFEYRTLCSDTVTNSIKNLKLFEMANITYVKLIVGELQYITITRP